MTALGACRVRSAETLAQLDGVAAAWDALALASPTRLPTASHAWVAAHLEHKRDAADPWRVFLAEDAHGRLLGVLPVVASPHALLGPRRPRLRVPCAFQTNEGDVLLDAGAPARTLDALLRAVAAWAPRRFSLEIGAVRPASPTLAAKGRVRWPGLVIDEHDVDGRHLPRAALEDAEARLGANFRRNLRKAANRLERTPGTSIRFLAGPEADVGVLRDFLALEASGWKGRAGTALAATSHSVAFYEAFVERARRRGWLEWHLLSIEGRLAAAHLAVRFGPSLVLLRIAYDESFARLSPGNALFRATLERAVADPTVDDVDCLTDMPWHDNWAMERRPYRRLRAYAPRAEAMALGWLPDRVRPHVKRLRRR